MKKKKKKKFVRMNNITLMDGAKNNLGGPIEKRICVEFKNFKS